MERGRWIEWGDILYWQPQRALGVNKRTARAAVDRRYFTTPWAGGVIPYTVNIADGAEPGLIRDAMDAWEGIGRVRFVARDDALHEHYVTFVRGGTNQSSVGCQRVGQQFVRLKSTVAARQVRHEIGHVVGLWHEHSRADRVAYIDVVESNLNQQGHDEILPIIPSRLTIGEYDFTSTMHYALNACALRFGQTMIPKAQLPANIIPGTWERISAGDRAKLAILYP